MNASERMAAAVARSSGLSSAGQRAAATTLPTAALRPGVAQPRRFFPEDKAQALAESVRKSGILQPILVRPLEQGGYEIVDGERRWRAAQAVGLSEVPVNVQAMTDEQARYGAMAANLVREDLTLIDEVEGKLALLALHLGTDMEEAKAELSRLQRKTPDPKVLASVEAFFALLGGENWRSFALNKLPIFSWPEAIREAMRGGLELTKAKTIRNAPEEMQADLLQKALAGATRAELTELVKTAKPTVLRSQAEEAGKKLSSRKWLDAQTPSEAEATAAWLALAPPHIAS